LNVLSNFSGIVMYIMESNGKLSTTGKYYPTIPFTVVPLASVYIATRYGLDFLEI